MGVEIEKINRTGSRIIFLGSGAGSSVVGKQIRASGGIIIQVNNDQFHIDPGPGSLVKARECGISLRENTAVLVSHAHIGHCNDINAVIDAMTLNGFDRHGVLISTNNLINGTENNFPYLTKYHRSFLEKVMVLKQGQKVAINETEIHAIPAYHLEECIGFKFITPYFSLAYSADTKYKAELIAYYKGIDILILNVKNHNNIKSGVNLNTEDAIKIIEKANPELAVITHFGLKMVEADPLYEAREIQKKVKSQIMAAKDGIIINPDSYAATSRQKTLNSFNQ
jgi:ribonuclease BN (tRNA processing enzyme)